ncbi:cytochrome p450 [Colletotrichum incanum]|uniref:Cytochrome p450 n=1 Tax=Colletotrichum incanum TaxID=1573173 RepID=A0A162MZG4_COLIC|nr:cytochrome p450 [Colletotrichum incanum]
MGAILSSLPVQLGVGAVLLLAFVAYRALLPKPLKDIPYNKDAAGKLLGDVPEMMSYVKETTRIFDWLTNQCVRHKSPIVQTFVKPGGKPWVVLTDPYETQDILQRRTKEFDRSGFMIDLISGILPEQSIQFTSPDTRFKKNRALINHLMAPSFILNVSAPEAYKAALTMIDLWKLKCDLAQGRPFAAHSDLTSLALDNIFASTFGLEEKDSNTIQRIKTLRQWKPDAQEKHDIDTLVPFPEHSDVPEIFDAILTLCHSLGDLQFSPVPQLSSWWLCRKPHMVKATAVKDNFLQAQIGKYISLIEQGDDKPRSALHSVLLRERDLAKKEERPPAYRRRGIRDEFLGFMMAGHDTTAGVVLWAVKFFADYPEAQDRLRADLRAAMPNAVKEKRTPTYEEIIALHIPFLEAWIEEVLRFAMSVAFTVRRAQVDTTVLGKPIPKGTDVWMIGTGPGYLEPIIPVDDSQRSMPGKKPHTGLWNDEDIGAFRPERWLKKDENGQEVFDGAAGPTLAFSLGPRACFGRKLAMQTLKLMFVLMIWEFEFLQCPESMSRHIALQSFAREPVDCYVRLAKVEF